MAFRVAINILFRLWLKPLWRHYPTVDQVRRRYGRADRIAAIGKRRAPVCEQKIDGVHVEWIGAEIKAADGVVVFLHGGAFAVRAPLSERRFCADLATRTGLPVLAVAYRLAPEHRFPAGLDDCCRVYEALLRRGIAAGRIILVGHSAGANLALGLLMRAHLRGLAQPAGAVLLSAPTDLTGASPSAMNNARRDVMMSPSTWPWVKQHYVGDAALTDPEVSPLFGDWAHLAPLHFHVSSTEILLDDSVRAAQQARNSGTEAQVTIWEDVPHSFPFIDGMTEAYACRRQIADFADEALARRRTQPVNCV